MVLEDRSRLAMAARGVTVTFGGVDAVKQVDLDLYKGEIHALTGENGAGKSSLAKVFGGVYRPRLGHVELDGQPIKFRSPKEALRQGVGLIHQEPLTFPDLNVAENIMVAHHPKRGPVIDWRESYRLAREILDTLGIDLDPRSQVGGLSIAKQQMVELACAMSHNAKVWIFDETTAPLTPKETDELFTVMRRLRDQSCALVIVTHHLQEIFDVADRITVLRDGAKVAETSPAKSSIPEVIHLMVGRELSSESFAPSAVATAEPFLKIEKLSGPGFRDVTLSVRPGEVVGLAGLVGAGRTELANAIFGLAKTTSGTVSINGKSTSLASPAEAIDQGIGLVPEDRRQSGLFGHHSISFNATLVRLQKLSKLGWIKPKLLESVSSEFREKLQVACQGNDQAIGELSGGNQQKVILARWLMNNPKLLILDEPTRGVDVGAKHEVHKLIRDLVKDGMAVLMISSDLPEVLALSDRIAVMREGRLVAEFPGHSATQDDIMFAATGSHS